MLGSKEKQVNTWVMNKHLIKGTVFYVYFMVPTVFYERVHWKAKKNKKNKVMPKAQNRAEFLFFFYLFFFF